MTSVVSVTVDGFAAILDRIGAILGSDGPGRVAKFIRKNVTFGNDLRVSAREGLFTVSAVIDLRATSDGEIEINIRLCGIANAFGVGRRLIETALEKALRPYDNLVGMVDSTDGNVVLIVIGFDFHDVTIADGVLTVAFEAVRTE